MELLMTEISHVSTQYLIQSLTYWPEQTKKPSISLYFLCKTTLKLKTPGGILVFRVFVQVCFKLDIMEYFHTPICPGAREYFSHKYILNKTKKYIFTF